MKNIILQILVVLLLTVSISAQENQPQLFDEFGKMPLDETMARIDNFANEVNKIPNSKALVRISGGYKNYYASAYLRGSILKAIWQNNRKSPAEKLSIQFCDVNQEQIMTRFFIIRENDKVEICEENLTFPKETFLFESSYFDTTYFQSPEIVFNPIENQYIYVEGTAGGYSGFALNVLKSVLKDSPASRLYVIAYLNTNFEEAENGKIIAGKPSLLDKTSYAQRMFRAARKELLKNGFSASQIVALDGGYVNGNNRRLEFWFVPPGGEIPKPKPDYVPKKAK